MKVEFKLTKNQKIEVYFDDVLYDSLSKNKNDQFYDWDIASSSDYVINKFDAVSSSDIPEGLNFHDFYKSESFEKLSWIGLCKENDELIANCSIVFEYKSWQSPFTMSSLISVYKARMEALGFEVDITDDEYEMSLDVSLLIKSQSILKSIEKFSQQAKVEFLILDRELTKESDSHLITKTFNFPSKYENICSQYILWFGELLMNLGIDADVSTENKNGNTFLTIDLHNNETLTSEIEKTLHLYLSLPYSEYLPAESEKSEVETKILMQSLKHQVQFFEQQLETKQSLLELKSLTNEKLKEELVNVKNKVILLESLQDCNVELFGGAVSISEYKIGPIVIKPKKILNFLCSQKNV